MEEIIKNPVFNWLIGLVVFLAQLFLRNKMDELKKTDERREKHIDELYKRTDRIPAIETDLGNLRRECERNHRK